jgi:O-antigen ligase
VIWGVCLAAVHTARFRLPELRNLLTKENIAVLLALLGTYSIASSSEAAEVLRNPVVQERIVRGGLTAASLTMSVPLLVYRIKRSTKSSIHGGLTSLGVYLGIALISTLYSAAPLVTAAKVAELAAGLAPVIVIALGPAPRRDLNRLLALILGLQAVMLAIAVAGFFLVPEIFSITGTRPGLILRETLRTPWAHSNTVSAFGALVATYILALSLRRQVSIPIGTAGAVLGISAILLASGRQGVIMLVVGIGLLLFFERRRLFLYLLGPGLTFLAITFWDSIFESLARDRPEALITFTGRLYWWEAALDAWSMHPWTGFGFGAGGRFVGLASIGTATTTSVHSGYVEALVGVGIFGSILILIATTIMCRWGYTALARRREVAAAALIVPLMLRTAVSLGFAGWLTTEFVLFVIIVALADASRADGSPPTTAPRVHRTLVRT